jgi:hypothetical protein
MLAWTESRRSPLIGRDRDKEANGPPVECLKHYATFVEATLELRRQTWPG